MKKILEEIRYDANFIRHHRLQPGWFKVLKIFILLGGIIGYMLWFGWIKTLVFVVVFLGLMAVVHFVYRTKTRKFTQSWLDFRIREENGQYITEPIGKYYYLAIIVNTVLAFLAGQMIPVA